MILNILYIGSTKPNIMIKIFSTRFSAKAIDTALLIARLGIGGMMLTHGIPKLAMLNENPVAFMDFMGLGPELSLGLTIFAEVVCSVLIMIGFATRIAVLPLIITMLVALFMVHVEDPFEKQEMACHYLLMYTVLLLCGSGRFSIDALISRGRHNH
jgi:putative oxidoreductase